MQNNSLDGLLLNSRFQPHDCRFFCNGIFRELRVSNSLYILSLSGVLHFLLLDCFVSNCILKSVIANMSHKSYFIANSTLEVSSEYGTVFTSFFNLKSEWPSLRKYLHLLYSDAFILALLILIADC